MKKILLIVNPKAGKGTIKRKLPRIIRNFKKQGYEIDTAYTKIDYSPIDILNNYQEKVDIIICCGGDGTLNQLINGIMMKKEKPQISFIPLGTMNDFARTIRISTNRIFLSKNINESVIVTSDIGTIDNYYFNYVVAFGAFTCVSYVTPQKLKKAVGKLAYFIVAIKYLNKVKNYKLTLEVNGEKITDNFVYGSISNSKSVGGFEWFKRKGVKLDDGRFEMLFIRTPIGLKNWIKTINRLLTKKHDNDSFYYFQTDKIKITSDSNIPWTIDGEYGGRKKEVVIRNENNKIQYIIPVQS